MSRTANPTLYELSRTTYFDFDPFARRRFSRNDWLRILNIFNYVYFIESSFEKKMPFCEQRHNNNCAISGNE